MSPRRAAPQLPKPTSAELNLLRTLWRLGPSTVKEVHDATAGERENVTYANVLRLLQVMHGKGLLTRDESARSHVYAAAQAQDVMQTSLLRDLIQKAFGGSGKNLVLAALKGNVSARERAEIADLLKAADDE
jgi:predicted transcriptional regulator